jgi:hypothetical protein
MFESVFNHEGRIRMKPCLKAYYIYNDVEEWGVGYFAYSLKEAKRMFWKEWHLEVGEYINMRGHKVKECKRIPTIFQQKGEIPLLLGYLLGVYSYYTTHVQCPFCHANSIDIEQEDERLLCEQCNREVTLSDLI